MAYLATRFVAGRLKEFDWIADAEVRPREEGQLYSGEAFVVPSDSSDVTERIEDALERTRELDCRNYDLTTCRSAASTKARSAEVARPAFLGQRSRIMVTGPSLTSVTSIIAPKRPISTWSTPAARSLSQK